MVSSRPFLYLSLPGVAFILGVFWFRHRNKKRIVECDKKAAIGGGDKEDNKNMSIEAQITAIEARCNANGVAPNKTTTPSMNINGSVVCNSDADNSSIKLFGKSAPIQIVNNGRNSPAKQQQYMQQIDSEVLKAKIQDAENKVLRSIDEDFENMSSPVDLPDSINHRVSFYTRNMNIQNDEPVVIKATMTPKISPENSFLEREYTRTVCEPNNNDECKHSSIEEHIVGESQAEDKSECCEESKELKSAETADENVKRNEDASSPSLSLCSIQSGDSGKGSSLPRSEATQGKTTYEFFFPNSLIGQLYGRKRSFINQIKAKTSANVVIRKNRYSGKLRICAVEGNEHEINAALMMIRQRLPAKRYPNFTMQRIHYALPQTIVPLSTESLINLQLNLIESINNDVVVSAVISGGHIFVQHPLHPSHPSLAVLQKCLYESYTTTEAPLLPSIEISAVCVLQVNGLWYRVQIIEQDADDEERCIVKSLDFGGYMNVHFNELKQIRSDFMAVPFQATECVLSNIEPIDSVWLPEAADILCKLTKGIVLQAQIAGYNSHNIPEIYLFACLGPNNVIFINKELVARNLARWVEIRD